jgi:hypothetical protein
MTLLRRKLPSVLGAAVLSVAFMATGVVTAAAAPNGTCTGGTFGSPVSIAAGTYRSLTIAGNCAVNAGNVTVQRNVTVLPGAGLNALFGGSRLTVGRNLLVGAGASLGLGCDPVELACFDNADATSSHTVWGNLIVDHGLLVIVHDNHIAGEVAQEGGGGGGSCASLFENGPPAYVDYAGNTIGSDATVSDLRTCWDGFSHNTVGGSVNLNNNKTTIPDGNLADGNIIAHDLVCFDDSPTPHLSDGPTKIKNVVGGVARGQCAAISVGAV